MATTKQQHIQDERRIPNEKAQEPLLSESYVPQTMPSILGRFDMTALFVCALFVLTMTSIGISRGVASLTYIVVSSVIFLVPCVIATAQLGSMFPSEGSLYTWTNKALGAYWSLFIGLCSLLAGILAVVTSAHLFVVILQAQNNTWLTEPWQQGMVILVIIGFAGFIGLQRARTTQNVINGLFLLVVCAVFLVGLSVAIWLAHGHASMVDLRRSSDWLVKPDNFSLFGIVSFAFLGVAGPLNLAGEIRRAGKQAERRIITRHLQWGSLIIVVCFLVTTLAVLVVQGPTVLPFDAFTVVHVALGSFVSDIAVICFAASCLASAIVYILVSARMYMVLGIDRRFSIWFARLNRYRIPSHAVIFQSLFAAGYTIIVFLIAPYVSIFGGSPTTRLVTLTTINTATMVVIWTVMTLFLFVALFLFLRRNTHIMRQQRLFPMTLLWGSTVVGFAACLGIIGAVLSHSWIPQLIGNSTWFYVVGGLSLTYLAIFAVWSMSHINQSEWEV